MTENESLKLNAHPPAIWQRVIPAVGWLRTYDRNQLTGDLLAGLIVAIMLVPQGMAYALLAGLPPQTGLYASILPLILYGLLGTSRTLAVGPVAMVSLLVASGIGQLAESGSDLYIQLALSLAFLVGIIQTLMGFLRAGFLVNFLSHPVLSGFTSAAAVIIGFSQLKHLLGVKIPSTESFFELVGELTGALGGVNWITLGVGGAAVLLLLFFKKWLAALLRRSGLSETLVIPLTKIGPLVAVVLGTAAVWLFGLHGGPGVRVVGNVPAGLPGLTWPGSGLESWGRLLPTALAISLVGYMESISVAKSLASKRREKVEPDQELIALGIANLGATFTGGYPVTGGISRSVVNFSAGARTGMASIITAVLIAATVLFLTPLFTHLPQAVLAAVIVVAIVDMIDVKMLVKTWRYNKVDGLSLAATFAAVLAVGVENGILLGALLSIIFYVWRTSTPHIAVVGRLGDSEIYRNVERHPVQTWEHILAIRVDESLYFANTRHLENHVRRLVAERPAVKHFILIASAVNFIDASALESLELLHEGLVEAGITFHLAAVKGPVMDRLLKTGFIGKIGRENIFESTHDAMQALGCFAEEPGAANGAGRSIPSRKKSNPV